MVFCIELCPSLTVVFHVTFFSCPAQPLVTEQELPADYDQRMAARVMANVIATDTQQQGLGGERRGAEQGSSELLATLRALTDRDPNSAAYVTVVRFLPN